MTAPSIAWSVGGGGVAADANTGDAPEAARRPQRTAPSGGAGAISAAGVPPAMVTPALAAIQASAIAGSSGVANAGSAARSGRAGSTPSTSMRPPTNPSAARSAQTTAGDGDTADPTTARTRLPPPGTVTATSRNGRTAPSGPASSVATHPLGAART